MRAALLLLVGLATPVAAQPKRPPPPPACAPCARGNALIDQFKIGAIRPLAGELAGMSLATRLTQAQYQTVIAMRTRHPELLRLGALDDTELALVATALCDNADNACTERTALSLRCLADRCEAEVPEDKIDFVDNRDVERCRQHERKKAPPIGVGFDWGNGLSRSRYPNDGRTWSLGLEGRYRIDRRWGLVARVDRTVGRDQAIDSDGDGHDDMFTGSIARVSALAGPSIVLDSVRYEHSTRFVRLDLLAGYLATPSQQGEDNVATGADLTFGIGALRLGARVVQGLGEAKSATQLLGHIGISTGSVPPRREDTEDCNHPSPQRKERSTPFAIGFEVPLGGYGIDEQLGYLATGFGIEGLAHLSRHFDLATHVDLLLYPGYERDRVIHEAAMAGIRMDHKKRRKHTGFYSTVMGGYTHDAGFTPTTSGSGPILDASIGWGGGEDETYGSVRLHGRFGLGDNTDYRAIFVSMGFELRLDPKRWRDRSAHDHVDDD